MVLTRLSHMGEVCPLRDHSYSDTTCTTGNQACRRIISVVKGSSDGALVEYGESPSYTYPAFNIIDFPTEILEKIFGFLTFKNIADVRRICKRFDKISTNLLNNAFQKLQNHMLNKFQVTKSMMPRRESARRKHPLARETDILETLHMRLTLLQMTFGKHIERKHCCFFAGDILDEVHRILRCIKSTPNMGKVFKITDELFDLSTMAMEYFKDHIEPSLPEISYFGSEFLDITNRFSGDSSNSSGGSSRMSEQEDDFSDRDPLPPSNMVLRKRIRKIRQGMKRYSNQLTQMKKQLKIYKSKLTSQHKQMMMYVARVEDYDRKVDETSRKLGTVFQELNKCKTELQYWRSKSPMHHLTYCTCGRLVSADHTAVVEPLMTPKEVEEKTLHPPQGWPLPQLSSPSPSSSVKNLEPLFDLETAAPAASSLPDKEDNTVPLPSRSPPFNLDKFGERSENGNKRFSTDDEDTDTDVDTVGKRVKERKRIRLEIQ